MTISSIHFQKAEVEFAKKHNFRTEKKEPEYLLDTQYRKTNEYLDLHDPKELYQEQMQLRKQNHCRGYAPQIKDVYWEAVVNLDEKHSLADVRKVADHIQQKYHIQTCSIALHHDEGYKDKDGTVKYNHHAHICFLTMDNGISTMRKIRSKELRQMQTDVAQLLGLERGKENSKATRLDHKQYREKAKELASAEQKHNQEIESAKLAVLEKVQPVLLKSVEEKKQLNSTAKRLQNKVLTLKAQKAIVEAERKKYKEEANHNAEEYRELQALNKTLYTEEQLNEKLQQLRDEHARRLTELQTQNTELQNKNTDLEAQLKTKPKEIIQKVVVKRELTEIEIEDLPRVKELQKKLDEVTQQRDNLLKFNSTVLQVIQAMYSDFDLEHPVQSLKKIYIAWKTQHQKSSITPQKRSQSDESTIKRVEVQQTSQSQSMSKFEALEPKEKLYTVQGLGYMTAEQIRAEAQSDDIGHFTSEEFKRALTADEFREVFGEPQQVPQKKQSLFSRVKHSLER